jgi:hypothetical protein
MSDWIRTKAGLEMAETIIRYLPRITVCLEEIAKNQKVKEIFYTEIENTKMSYVLTEEIIKIGKKLDKAKDYESTTADEFNKEIITYGDKKLRDYGPPYGPHNSQGNKEKE